MVFDENFVMDISPIFSSSGIRRKPNRFGFMCTKNFQNNVEEPL